MSPVTLDREQETGPASASLLRRARPALGLLASLYMTVQLCLVVWVAVPSLTLGWRPQVVLSGSMSPGMHPGDVVLIERPSTKRLPVGSMVVFDDVDTGRSIIHRVVDDDDRGAYRTKGDANPTIDARPLPPAEVRGVGRLLVPLVGTPAMWLQTGQLGMFATWAVVTPVALALARRPRRARNKAAAS